MTATGTSDKPGVVVIGRYALHDAIAAGGMATVHVGRLLGPVGFSRTVAIKRLHPNLAQDPEFVQMFMDEAKMVARVQHPNVVQTIDVVAMESEIFIVMEYVHGESLSRLLRAARARKEQMPLRIVSALMTQTLHGLHAAHEAKSETGEPLNIVHRDISPQNVLCGVDGIARLLDFGVAKAAGRSQATTKEGVLKGKLPYMAPEQLRGAPPSRRTDLYSCGLVLWEMISGERLYSGESEASVLAQLLEGNIAPPSRRGSDRMRVNESLDERTLAKLDGLTLCALDQKPERRFETAKDMAVALERVLPPATTSEVGAWIERVAAAELRIRAQRVANVESLPPPAPPSESSTPAAAVIAKLTPSKPVPRSTPADDIETKMASPSGSRKFGSVTPPPATSPAPTPDVTPSKNKRKGAIVVLAGAVILGFGVATVVDLARKSTPPASSTTNATTSAASSMPVPVIAPSPVVSATPSAAPSASVETSSEVKRPSPNAGGTKPKTPKTPAGKSDLRTER